jgi:spermidine synthase
MTRTPDSTGKKRIFTESLNANFGFFYTVNRTVQKAQTAFQKIELLDTDEFGKVLLLDNITQIGERSEYCYHEPMVHPAMCSHPKPESVLIIGGGDGGILREVLKYPVVKRIELVELDDQVISFARKHLKRVHRGAFSDPRVRINIADGRGFTSEHPAEFDIIIMDMTDPSGPSRLLYSREFYRTARAALRSKSGIFVMHSESPIVRPAAFASISKTLHSVFTHVNQLYTYIQMYGVLWSFALASTENCTAGITRAKIDRKLHHYGIAGLKIYNGETHLAMQTPYPFISELLKKPARIITDSRPDFPDAGTFNPHESN